MEREARRLKAGAARSGADAHQRQADVVHDELLQEARHDLRERTWPPDRPHRAGGDQPVGLREQLDEQPRLTQHCPEAGVLASSSTRGCGVDGLSEAALSAVRPVEVVRVDCQSLQSLTGTVGRGRALTALGHIHVAPLVVVGGWSGHW